MSWEGDQKDIKISWKEWDKEKALALHYFVSYLSFKSTYLINLSLWKFFYAVIYSVNTVFNCAGITQYQQNWGHSQFGLYSQSIVSEPRSRITDYIYCSKTKYFEWYL